MKPKGKPNMFSSLSKDDREYLYIILWNIYEMIEERELREAKNEVIQLINRIKK